MTLAEVILGGIAVALLSSIATKLIATRNLVTKEYCTKTQGACMALVRSELEHIKGTVERLEEGQDKIFDWITKNGLSRKNS